MKKFAFVAALALSTLAIQAKAVDERQYKIGSVKLVEVVPTHEELYSVGLDANDTSVPDDLDEVNVVLDKITVIGKKVIDIVKAGAPVINIRRDAVHVVPQGVTAWQQLAGWSAPTTKVYRLNMKNMMGMDVVDMRLKVSATPGGNLNGKGRYLANVYIVPTRVYAKWGFNVDLWMENQNPVNVGTKARPMAGLGADLEYRVTTVLPLSEVRGAQNYFFSGDGRILTP